MKWPILIMVLMVTLCLWSTAVAGQDANQYKTPWPSVEPAGSGGPGIDLLLRTVVSLLLVLGLIIGLAVLTKRIGPRLSKVRGRQITLVETMPLGSRRALHVVEFAGRHYLIASTTSQITLLASRPCDSPDRGRS